MQQEGALRALLETVAGPAWVKDAQGCYLLVNGSAVEALGRRDGGEVIGRGDDELLPPRLAAERRRRERQVVSTGASTSFRETIQVRGRARVYQTSMRPWRDGDGDLAGVVGICQDVTDREHAEQELRRSLTLLRAVADGTTDVIYVKDLAGRYLLVNQAGARWLGLTADEVTGKDDNDLFSPELARAFRANDERVMASGTAETYEQVVPTDKGVQVSLSTKAPYRDEAGHLLGVIGVTRDITKRKQAEEERARLLARLGDLREEERRRLALELHDGPVQNLAVVNLELDEVSILLKRLGRGDLEHAQRLVSELHDVVEAEIGDLRRMMSDLRPLLLDQQGLVAALRALVETVRARSGLVRCSVRARLGGERLDGTVETTLFRVAQQALANVAEHADAREVTVTLERAGEDQRDQVVLRVEDDGRGFDPARLALEVAGRGRHVGLDAMRERVQALGGRLEVDSGVGRGTRVEARVPWRVERRERSRP